MAMVYQEKHHSLSATFTRFNELNGRHRVQSSSTQVGLEAGPSYFSEDSSTIGAPISRSIYESPISLVATVCQLETRPPSHGNRFLLHELDHSPRQDLRQPTMGPDRQSPVNSPELKGLGDGSSGSCLESPSMIPSAFANVGQRTIDHSTLSRDNSVGVPEQSPRYHTTV